MRTIGVIGGMGPAAAADFYARVVAAHGALCDQDHPPCIMYSATQVPDRTAFLLENGADPTPELVASVNLVEAAVAEVHGSYRRDLVPLHQSVARFRGEKLT